MSGSVEKSPAPESKSGLAWDQEDDLGVFGVARVSAAAGELLCGERKLLKSTGTTRAGQQVDPDIGGGGGGPTGGH